MKKNFIKRVSILLIVCLMMLQITSSVFAYEGDNIELQSLNSLSTEQKELVKDTIENPSFSNLATLTPSNQKLVQEVIKNPKKHLSDATVINDKIVLVYNTSDANTKVAYTDGFVEVVKKLDQNTISINDQLEKVEYTKTILDTNSNVSPPEYVILTGGWFEISNPGGSWNYHANIWHDIVLEQKVIHYTSGTLAAIIGLFLSPGTAFVFGIAMLFVTAPNQNSSILGIREYMYHHATLTNPMHKKCIYYNYLKLNGSWVYEGSKTAYFLYNVY